MCLKDSQALSRFAGVDSYRKAKEAFHTVGICYVAIELWGVHILC